ncbi:hypothetical protein [Streptomyces sp. NBC_01320]|uniref:hypothetical protein n=1 Tax=Streptomyces sp. NBC_01320 TaxID=2903824 RepID=UPI002E13CA10|nr:hypothetical protein OG395_35070 [Streptomyces sp. NBC_01320]
MPGVGHELAARVGEEVRYTHVDAVIALTATQANGGDTLVYKDGTGHAFRWKAPAANSGPDVAAVKKQLQ